MRIRATPGVTSHNQISTTAHYRAICQVNCRELYASSRLTNTRTMFGIRIFGIIRTFSGRSYEDTYIVKGVPEEKKIEVVDSPIACASAEYIF